MTYLLSTSGTVQSVRLADLNGYTLEHPTVEADLSSQFSNEEIVASEDLQVALAAGELIEAGVSVQDLMSGGNSMAYFDVYDNDGDKAFTSSAALVRLTTIRKSTDPSAFGLVGGCVLIKKAGFVQFSFRVSAKAYKGGKCSTMAAWLERNSGSGYAEVDGTQTFDTTDREKSSCTASCSGMLDVAVGDLLRLRTTRREGRNRLKTLADGSGLSLVLHVGG